MLQAATAKKLADEGILVILVARRLERLKDLAEEILQKGGKAQFIPTDLTQEEDRAGE